ncbi:MAG: glucose 1-dehydrogenase [Bacteroidetes bacterium]|nr:glucose 1-dehydrogenase [Bacteroidota bacterium]
MKAISIKPGTTSVQLVDRPEPKISAPDDVKVKVIRVGICGTDREETAGGRSLAPDGSSDLVLGHEMFGRVVEVGKSVTRVKTGDFVAFTVRRGCGKCMPCLMNRSDMCLTGEYHERGIWGLDGYQTEFVVDKEQYVVHIPPELEAIGVLAEPTSVAEKAIDEAVRVQTSRLPDAGSTPGWLYGKTCLVAGLGPIGLLASVALVLRGARVYGLDIVDEASTRPQWLKTIGGKYIDGRMVPAQKVADSVAPMDVIVDATGAAPVEFNLLDALALNGVYVLTGVPGGDRAIQIDGADLIRRLVLKNQVMIGSVNAARDHFQMAVDDLAHARLLWGDHLTKLITDRHRFDDFLSAFQHHADNEIKSVIEW